METIRNWTYQKDEDNVYWLSFNRQDSNANTLNGPVMIELDAILSEIQENKPKGLVIKSTKPSGFILGADIAQFTQFTSSTEATALIKKGQAVFNKLEQLPFPTVALIEGFCLGGGLELALACQYRIGEDSNKTRLALPEVKLGIQPGWGGTVRLPEQIGILNAMDLILSGRLVTAKAAKKLGLVQEAVPKRLLDEAAKYYAMHAPRRRSLSSIQSLLECSFIRPVVGKFLIQKLKGKISKKHYPAPFQIVENWMKYGIKRPQSFEIEAQSIGKLFFSETSKNLIKVFYLREQLRNLGKKIDIVKADDFSARRQTNEAPEVHTLVREGVSECSQQRRKFICEDYNEVKNVHVIGAGVMGGDIAAWSALQGYKVTLQDQAPKLIGNAVKRAYELAQKQLKEKHLVQAMMDRLYPDPEGKGIAQADIIIEAITENVTIKQELFLRLEKEAKPKAILATNTSTIPLEEIGAVLADPSRIVGVHFFNPVAKMPLVEIVKGRATSEVVVDKVLAFVRTLDKLPLPVKSSPGFLVNRILLPYMLEAMMLLREGISASVIDKAAVNFGMPMGPVELADTVGLDICVAGLEKLAPVLGVSIPNELKDYVARGELGRKTGKGFYEYKNNRAIKPKISHQENIPHDIAQRLILRILNESMACLREGIVENADRLDAGCIFGFGFPPFRGGPMAYAKQEGIQNVIARFENFRTRYGERFLVDKGWCSEVA